MLSAAYSRILLIATLALLTSYAFAQSIAEYKAELIRMMESDQQGREEIAKLRDMFGNVSSELDMAWEKQNLIDAENLLKLEEIIEHYGWPAISAFGQEAATGAFLILQHSDHAHQKQYLPVFRHAVELGEARGSLYALLYDRVLVGEGKMQLYGSQLMLDEATGAYYLWPVEDESNVDSRRATYDMEPLADYLKRFPFELGDVPAGINATSSDEADL